MKLVKKPCCSAENREIFWRYDFNNAVEFSFRSHQMTRLVFCPWCGKKLEYEEVPEPAKKRPMTNGELIRCLREHPHYAEIERINLSLSHDGKTYHIDGTPPEINFIEDDTIHAEFASDLKDEIQKLKEKIKYLEETNGVLRDTNQYYAELTKASWKPRTFYPGGPALMDFWENSRGLVF